MPSTENLLIASPPAAPALPTRRTAVHLTIAAATASLLIAAAPHPVLGQTAVVVDVVAVAQGYRFSDLQGHKILNQTGDDIGKLDDLIITKEKLLYAIISVGGFLGLGAHLVAVPYDSLNISADAKSITLPDASKAQLEQMPEFKYSASSSAKAPAGDTNANTNK